MLKPVSAAISIGTGGPFGAEGPIIMTGGAIGSMIAQLLHLSADERKTLLVAGAAAGMAATFNSPLAPVLLAVELLLFEWRPRSFVPVVAAVAIATVCAVPAGLRAGVPGLTRPAGPARGRPLSALVGLSGGLLAVAATWLVYRAEDMFARLPVHWMWWPAIGGLIIGIGGLIEPRALGVGYDVIDAAADWPRRRFAHCRHPRGQDLDLVAVPRIGHLRRRAGADLHDRRRARRLEGTCSRGRAGSGRCSASPRWSVA